MLSVITALQVTLSMRLDDEVADGFTMNVLRSPGLVLHTGMWARACALKGASENRCIARAVCVCVSVDLRRQVIESRVHPW